MDKRVARRRRRGGSASSSLASPRGGRPCGVSSGRCLVWTVAGGGGLPCGEKDTRVASGVAIKDHETHMRRASLSLRVRSSARTRPPGRRRARAHTLSRRALGSHDRASRRARLDLETPRPLARVARSSIDSPQSQRVWRRTRRLPRTIAPRRTRAGRKQTNLSTYDSETSVASNRGGGASSKAPLRGSSARHGAPTSSPRAMLPSTSHWLGARPVAPSWLIDRSLTTAHE